MFSQKLRIYYILFYKNNVNWSRGWVVLKFSFVLNNRPLFSTLIFSLVFFYKIVLKNRVVTKNVYFLILDVQVLSEIERRLEVFLPILLKLKNGTF